MDLQCEACMVRVRDASVPEHSLLQLPRDIWRLALHGLEMSSVIMGVYLY